MNEKWDLRFLQLASVVASWSKDPSTKCGAVIVRPDKTVASVGFNGFPQGCDDEAEYYNHRETKYSRVIHDAVNAIIFAREPLNGYTMYTWPPAKSPTCDRCATVVIQSGIRHVVCLEPEPDSFNERWLQSQENALMLYREAGVEVRHARGKILDFCQTRFTWAGRSPD